jgi:hypothetical protein
MFTRIFFCSCLLLVSSISAQSIVIRHDRHDALYIAYGARFRAVGQVSRGGEGVLISPQWVLSAAHVGESLGPFARYVVFGDERYEIQKVVFHPEWVSRGGIASGRDIALLKLDRPVKGIEPVALYAKDDEVGKVVTFVGRGLTGTGVTGPVRDLGRALRGATNKVDTVNETSIQMVFDAPPSGTDLEGISGPGDSGGPALLEVGGKLYTLGVSSTNSGRREEEHCKYGTTETYTRVSTSREWIEKVVASDAPGTASATAWGPVVKVGKGQGLPEIPAGRVAAAYVAAFNSGLNAEIRKFNEQHRSESFWRGRTPAQAVGMSRELMDKLGPLELYGYSRGDDFRLSVLTYSQRGKSWQAFTFELEPAPPHKLAGIGMSPADAPTKRALR